MVHRIRLEVTISVDNGAPNEKGSHHNSSQFGAILSSGNMYARANMHDKRKHLRHEQERFGLIRFAIVLRGATITL